MININSITGDVLLLILAGVVIGILHIPLLTLLGGKRTFLFLLSGICIISPVAPVYANRIWWISMHVDGAYFRTRIDRDIWSISTT